MKGTKIILILGLCALGLLQAATATTKWPKCTNQTDLLEYYLGIFERNSQNSAVKRELTWDLSCIHASIIKDEDDVSQFSYQIYQCCGECQFPTFSLCTLGGYSNWLCGSEAYDCVFSCRDEDSVLEAVVSAGAMGWSRKREVNITDSEATVVRKRLRRLRKEKKCYKKTCTMKNGERDCCLVNTCVPVTDLTNELEKKKKIRSRYLKKLARAKTTASAKKKRGHVRGGMGLLDNI
ncbi:uncharacterized protein LOC114518326 [Dendronephthya gigantea]|uniref:uncharacterized protein LOC114518326 n=1 Tax=Dendronephthya gigantea TaxID=151771 RepID=UPI00106BCC3F|nr:uncharacterized protein LOC114518326 [Dendronephthya gigantea]